MKDMEDYRKQKKKEDMKEGYEGMQRKAITYRKEMKGGEEIKEGNIGRK